jgi:hypothetical protein
VIIAAYALFIASSVGQPIPDALVRDSFRKVALRATFSISREDTDNAESLSEARKALNEVEIEAASPEEKLVYKLLLGFSSQVRTNGAIRRIIRNQLELDTILRRPDLLAQYDRSKADNSKMDEKENGCSGAIEEMLRRKLEAHVPKCDQVSLKDNEITTKLTR